MLLFFFFFSSSTPLSLTKLEWNHRKGKKSWNPIMDKNKKARSVTHEIQFMSCTSTYKHLRHPFTILEHTPCQKSNPNNHSPIHRSQPRYWNSCSKRNLNFPEMTILSSCFWQHLAVAVVLHTLYYGHLKRNSVDK